METVTIPEFMRPFECTINNVHYGPYAPGATMEVPAEVAALIRDNANLAPVENPPETISEEIERVSKQEAYDASKAIVVDLGAKDLTALVNVTSIVSVDLFNKLKTDDCAVKVIFKWTNASGDKLNSTAYQFEDDIYVFAYSLTSNAPSGVSYLRLTKDGSTIKAVAGDVPFDAE